MIYLEFRGNENFLYDVQGLAMSFYPRVEVKEIHQPEEEPMQFEPGDRLLRVEYLEKEVRVSLCRGEDSPVLSGVEPVDFSNRKEAKSVVKRLVYGILSEDTDKTLPWGTLTGIRPTKIPMAMLEEGASDGAITSYMEQTYLTSPEKTALSLEIAKREREVLKDVDYQNGYSLYIGIPFCPTTCLYCSFTSYPVKKWAPRMDEYLDALFKEIDYTRLQFVGRPLDSIYIGGGTPTTLEPEHLERLLTEGGGKL